MTLCVCWLSQSFSLPSLLTITCLGLMRTLQERRPRGRRHRVGRGVGGRPGAGHQCQGLRPRHLSLELSVCSACSDDLAACNVNLAARAADLDRLCTIDVEAIKVCGEQTEPEEAPMRACFTRALKRADAACPSGRFVF